MKLHQQLTPELNTIRAIEQNRIRINDDYYESSLLVSADSIHPGWKIDHHAQITADVISDLLTHDVEIILIGTGSQHQLLDSRISMEAINRGVGVEIMSTEAACHTYNILIGEDRSVLAALIIENNQD